MCKVIGFIMFWIAIGMLLAFFVENVFIEVCIILLLIIVGFNLFCH